MEIRRIGDTEKNKHARMWKKGSFRKRGRDKTRRRRDSMRGGRNTGRKKMGGR